MTDITDAIQGLADTVGAPDDDQAMVREVIEGLSLPLKRISSKFHYDERGSKLFEQITKLDEYYPTRIERDLLRKWMPIWVAELRPATLVELGAGSAEKSRVILDAMVHEECGTAYVPVDVSHDFLRETARRISDEYPGLEVLPTVADITAPLRLPEAVPHPSWIAFLGSTLGNFDDAGAAELIGRIAVEVEPSDAFLLGVDLRPGPHKTVERIELAYDDPSGVTAEFSLNVLSVLNAEVGSDFDPSAFRHRSSYSLEEHRIETFLESLRDQRVRFGDGTQISIAAGELVRTEISCKYDRPTIASHFAGAGLALDRWVEDERGFYALALGSLASQPIRRRPRRGR